LLDLVPGYPFVEHMMTSRRNISLYLFFHTKKKCSLSPSPSLSSMVEAIIQSPEQNPSN
jgi:hypothetical protein